MDNDRAKSANQTARDLGVKNQQVLRWIHEGQLVAYNLAADPTGRPRWKILPEDLADFLAGRRATPAPKPRPRRRRLRAPQQEYY